MGIEPGVARRLEELRAAARYDGERRDLYRAQVLGPRPTRPARLEELQRAAALSESRLRRAERAASDADGRA
ncbi:MAG TPA: hypothetical protein VF712_14065 [Thermoleophilaceae bacterium]|jgi:hypothetical protein